MNTTFITKTTRAQLALGLMALYQPAFAVTDISFCDEINQPGSYRVTQDLISRSQPQCILIDASNVTLDLQGHTIAGDGSANSRGIWNADNRNSVNIEVRNGSIVNFGVGVDLRTASGVRVERIRVVDSVNSGIVVGGGSNLTANSVVNTVRDAGSNSGIVAGRLSSVTDNFVSGLMENAIQVGPGSIVRSNVGNSGSHTPAFTVVCPSLVSDNVAVTKLALGIVTFDSGCRLTNNVSASANR